LGDLAQAVARSIIVLDGPHKNKLLRLNALE